MIAFMIVCFMAFVVLIVAILYLHRKITWMDDRIGRTVDNFVDGSSNLAAEVASMEKRIEKLEANDSSTTEKMQMIADNVADELNKRWDEGMQQIIDYNPLKRYLE